MLHTTVATVGASSLLGPNSPQTPRAGMHLSKGKRWQRRMDSISAQCSSLAAPTCLLQQTTSHLVKILGDASFESIKNPRLFHLKEKTLQYNYLIKHVPGAKHASTDACSQSPAVTSHSGINVLAIVMEPEELGEPDVIAVQCDLSLVASLNPIHDPSHIAASAVTLSCVP